MQKLDLSKLKKEHLALLYLLIILLIVWSVYLNIFKPLIGRIENISEQVEYKKRDIQRARISSQALKELEDKINELEDQADYYHRSLKGQADVPQILKEMMQIAEGLKIEFVSVNPLGRKEMTLPGGESLLLRLPIEIKLYCEYHQLGIFINQIENSPNFMKISKLNINIDKKDIWIQKVELVITSSRLVSEPQL